MSKEYTGPFPQKARNDLQGDEKPGYIGSSESTGMGTTDGLGRMPSPNVSNSGAAPNSETGEGKGD